MIAVTDLKRTHRATWAAGDYAAVAELIDAAPPRDLLAHMDLRPGQDVLDVATGTGNAAIPAAHAGARVVGLDLTPELFETARRRADQHAVAIDWIEGDAEELPFEDESFDRVLSVFGVQFAPRHELVARELARVSRPGGRIGLVNWTPRGLIGELLKTIGSYMPAPPDYASPPPLWGSEQHVRRLFSDSPIELAFARGYNPWRFDSRRALRRVHGDPLRPDAQGTRAPHRRGPLAGLPRRDRRARRAPQRGDRRHPADEGRVSRGGGPPCGLGARPGGRRRARAPAWRSGSGAGRRRSEAACSSRTGNLPRS